MERLTEHLSEIRAFVKQVRQAGFRRVVHMDIGGRYSALSFFGMIPAALLGLEVEELLDRGHRMACAYSSSVTIRENSGVVAEMAGIGRDQIIFLAPPCIQAFGLWLGQLIAESTGKRGNGLVPVVGDTDGDAAIYGRDRLFVHFILENEQETELARDVQAH